MALVIETGAGVTGANAYCAVADVDTYSTSRNQNTAWTALSTAAKEAAIVEATLYLETKFRYAGTKNSYGQGLSWPRLSAYDSSAALDIPSLTVPPAIKIACMDLALKSGLGTVILDDSARGGMTKMEKVGPLEVQYADNAPVGTDYGIEGLLKGIIIRDGVVAQPLFQSPEYSDDQYFTNDQFNNNGSSSGGAL